jgi:hypothetical protein
MHRLCMGAPLHATRVLQTCDAVCLGLCGPVQQYPPSAQPKRCCSVAAMAALFLVLLLCGRISTPTENKARRRKLGSVVSLTCLLLLLLRGGSWR